MITLNLLFVDDDSAFLDTVSQLFKSWSQDTWHIHQAPTAARALELLAEHAIDLAVMDMQMPVMDGLQFLALLNHIYPALRKVALTAFPDENCRAECLKQGVELFLEKPRSPEGFATVFATLKELTSLQPQTGFQGLLDQAGPPEVMTGPPPGESRPAAAAPGDSPENLIALPEAAPTAKPETAPALPELEARTRIDEMVVCSGQNEVLYEWQCPEVDTRLKLLNWITQRAEVLGRLCALERFDRLEMLGPDGRMVAVIAADQKLLVRSSRDNAAGNQQVVNA